MPPGLAFSVSRIIWKSDCGIGCRSTTQEALKILWRQCSEFACANIVSSTSVGLRPLALEVREEVVDLVRREGEAHRRVRLLDGGAAAGEHVDLRQRLRGDVAEEEVGLVEGRRERPPSCGRGGGAGRRRASPGSPSRWKAVPRSMRRTRPESPHWRAMSVALEDQGEIVPGRGVTRIIRPRSCPAGGASGP